MRQAVAGWWLLSVGACVRTPFTRPPEESGDTQDPALTACLAEQPDAAALLEGEGGPERVLAAVAPGSVSGEREDGTSVALVVTAEAAGPPSAEVLIEGYPAGDPRGVADGMGCAPHVAFDVTVRVTDAGGGWSFSAPGRVRFVPTAALPPRGLQVTLFGAEAVLDPATVAAMALPTGATGRVQVGAYGLIGAPEDVQGWLAIETPAAGPGVDTGRGQMEDRWSW